MCAADPFQVIDQLNDDVLGIIAERLESRAKHPFIQRVMADYLDALDVDSAETVLDLGTGTGMAARVVARRPGFNGTVTGIDLSPYLVDLAERYAQEEGFGDRLSFRVGDTRTLELESDTFDTVIAHTLFSHIDQPLDALDEIRRVLRPGGMIALFDGDYASMTFALDDPLEGKNSDEKIISAISAQPFAMRIMPRLIRQAGLTLEHARAYAMTEVGEADYWKTSVETYARLAAQSGAMSEAAAGAWLEEVKRSSDAGTFFGSCNYITYIVRRPA